MTLVINGCSFGECWKPSEKFVKGLGCDESINLSKSKTSFQRTVRSTIEWLSYNPKPRFFVIPITFTHRWEMCFGKTDRPIDGIWTPLQNSQFIEQKDIDEKLSVDKIKKFVDMYYGLNFTIRTYWDKCFTEIILLSSFFEHNNIDYIMFDMCNDFKKKHITGYNGFEKINLIEKNKKIIDLWNFCGNKFMWNTLDPRQKDEVDVLAYHHEHSQYIHLENYLLDYINSCTKK